MANNKYIRIQETTWRVKRKAKSLKKLKMVSEEQYRTDKLADSENISKVAIKIGKENKEAEEDLMDILDIGTKGFLIEKRLVL